MKAHGFSVEPNGHEAGSPQGQMQAWPKGRTKRQKENNQLEMWERTQGRKRKTTQGPRNAGNTVTRKTCAAMSNHREASIALTGTQRWPSRGLPVSLAGTEQRSTVGMAHGSKAVNKYLQIREETSLGNTITDAERLALSVPRLLCV